MDHSQAISYEYILREATNMIIVHAYMKVNPANIQAFLIEANLVAAKSKAEDGNISYYLYQDSQKENIFVMLEKWKDKKATEIHRETEHFKAFIKEMNSLLMEPMCVDRFEASDLK
jgi:quinol monooxygenase YgiN